MMRREEEKKKILLRSLTRDSKSTEKRKMCRESTAGKKKSRGHLRSSTFTQDIRGPEEDLRGERAEKRVWGECVSPKRKKSFENVPSFTKLNSTTRDKTRTKFKKKAIL